jgi:hypothetical protein
MRRVAAWAIRPARLLGYRCAVQPKIERRRTPRLLEDVPGLLTRSLYDADIHAVRIRDLGDGGACAVSDFDPPVGTEFYAGFFLRGFGGIPLIAKVRVAWTRPEHSAHAIGLMFLCDGPAQVDSVVRIRDYLAARRREPAAAPV